MFLILILLLLCLYLYLQNRSLRLRLHFQGHGIPYLPLNWGRTRAMFSGSLDPVFTHRQIYADALSCSPTTAPFVAMASMLGGGTDLYIRDPELVRHILVKDFDHFTNLPNVTTQKSSKYFPRMLTNMGDEQWRGVRAKLSTAFTTGKLRRMYPIFQQSAASLVTFVKEQGLSPEGGDFGEYLFKYSMDVIASACFGVDGQVWGSGGEGAFEKYGKRYGFIVSGKNMAKYLVMTVCPRLADALELDIFDWEAQEYFAGVAREVMRDRRQKGERRNDFLQLMMDAQENLLMGEGEEPGEEGGAPEGDAPEVRFTDEDVIANALLFFIAGFDTTQTVLLFTLYNLALHPEAQERCWEEVKGEGPLTFDGVNNLPYLQQVINETMRMYPAFPVGLRSCTRDWQVPDMPNFTIRKGTTIQVPFYGIHNDPRYYPNPEKFIPERWTPEEKASRHPYSFLPFGQGPRMCIGNRFALTQVRSVVAELVRNFKVEPCDRTRIPVEFENKFAAKPKGGMWLKVTPRDPL